MTDRRSHARFGWIEASLRYTGEFDKRSYGAHFRLGDPQISADQREFVVEWFRRIEARDLVSDATFGPDHLRIDKGRIVIDGALPAEPVFEMPSMREWLKSSTIPFREVDSFRRVEPRPAIFHAICDAIRGAEAVAVDYVSLTSGATRRDISPHAIVDSSGRLHVRAYDHLHNDFRDFVLARIRSIGRAGATVRYVGPERDLEWQEEETIRLRVNPELSPEQAAIVRLDYGLPAEGAREIRAPKALAFYIRANLAGPGPKHVPPVLVEREAN
ncbi:WYL domain-containing protein [Cereibacter sphaeroides]|uniref:helix-turn-helix transcriptional regulator n=1 Tax=Cereibacter sphaeroides TaxID=1063 RepID=UPI001F1D2A01|nr:WYL domain-containing protein [Cereibacter sphaeroides]MCE6958514.1 WYL domain-containing protein [Cereibacter sphaeroides]MCE6972824.1 WYL domain-containing protein [Cereibacter sphaeroides]